MGDELIFFIVIKIVDDGRIIDPQPCLGIPGILVPAVLGGEGRRGGSSVFWYLYKYWYRRFFGTNIGKGTKISNSINNCRPVN
jgi:hypothetical protein